jgi:replication-associated recombination protein RarA
MSYIPFEMQAIAEAQKHKKLASVIVIQQKLIGDLDYKLFDVVFEDGTTDKMIQFSSPNMGKTSAFATPQVIADIFTEPED